MAGQEIQTPETLRNGPARGPRGSDTDIDTGLAKAIIPDAIAGFQQASASHQIDTIAAEAAELATTQREAAESLQAQGVADPLEAALSTTTAQRDELTEKELEVSAISAKTFDRYKKAVLQGATNSQAARIAVQKEMRNLISRYPVHADVIRRAAADATGNDEFLVRSRDVAKPQRQELTEYQKGLQNVISRVNTMYEPGTEAYEVAMQREVGIYNTSQTKEAELAALDAQAAVGARNFDSRLKIHNQLDSLNLTNYNAMAAQAVSDGVYSPDEHDQLVSFVQQERSERYSYYYNEAIAADMPAPQAAAAAKAAVSGYDEYITALNSDDPVQAITRINNMFEQGQINTVNEAFPVMRTIEIAFPNNSELAMDVLFRKSATGDLVLLNSPIFKEAKQQLAKQMPGYEVTADMVRNHVLYRLGANAEAARSGRQIDEQASILHLTTLAAMDPENRDANNGGVLSAYAARNQQTVASIVGETAGELSASEQKLIKNYKKNWDAAREQAATELRKWSNPEAGKVAFAVLVENPNGGAAIEIRRFTQLEENGKVRWIPAGGTQPLMGGDGYNLLYGAYGTADGGVRRLVDREDVRELAFGNTRDWREQLLTDIAAINSASGYDLPAATFVESNSGAATGLEQLRTMGSVQLQTAAGLIGGPALAEIVGDALAPKKEVIAPGAPAPDNAVPAVGERNSIVQLLNELN